MAKTKDTEQENISAPPDISPVEEKLERPEGFRVKLWEAADTKRKRAILALPREVQLRYSASGEWPEEGK